MIPAAGLIGRESERERLARAVASAAGGRASVVAVVGAYGLGKTTLLDAVRADGAARGATVLSTQGRAADAELGFASLLTLLRPVEAALDDLAGDLAPALRAALALGQRKASPVATRVATFRVLSALAAQRPLIVLVDDAHLLDRASADVLAFATGRFCADAVLTVVAAEQYVPTAFDELDAETIPLDGLPDDDIARIVAAALPLAAEPLRRCVMLADGNPLVGLELAASLDPPQRSGEAPMPTIPRLSGVIGSAFARRLDRLSEAACNALAMVAADDTGELAVVEAALRRLGEPDDGLAEAEVARLVTTDGSSVRFTHPLLRPVAYHQIGAASRRVAHGALAAALAAPPPVPAPDRSTPTERSGARTQDALDDRALVLGAAAAVDAGLPEPAPDRSALTERSGARTVVVAVGGVGLDLAVSRAIAAMHAGDVAGAHDQLLRLDAADRAGAVAARAEKYGLGWFRGRAAWVLGRIALAAGDDQTAVDQLRAACRVVPHLAAADFVTAAAAADRTGEARTRAASVRRLVRDRAPILDVRARRAIGALGAATELDAALDRAEVVGLPLPRGARLPRPSSIAGPKTLDIRYATFLRSSLWGRSRRRRPTAT